MSIPYQDWQFWVTTLLALIAGGYLLRNILPVPFFSRRARARRQEKSATLTVSAKKHE
jgi:hypothetical protein